MRNFGMVLVASLVLLTACTQSEAPVTIQPMPLIKPMITHQTASGCDSAHDEIYLPGVAIDAYPGMPPQTEPKHLVMHFSDGTTLWEKPHYSSQDCSDYLTCRYATMVRNPIWNQCSPKGILYEIAAADGRPLLDSSFWVITEPTTKASAYVSVACGRGFAGPTFTAVSNQIAERDCIRPSADALPTGMNVAAAMALGSAYFNYRAAYNRPVYCVTDELTGTTQATKCY